MLARYGKLGQAEIKNLVVDDKWFASLRAAVECEVQRLTQQLAGRVKELDERYARPLPEREGEVEIFSAKVEGHLKKIGVRWQRKIFDRQMGDLEQRAVQAYTLAYSDRFFRRLPMQSREVAVCLSFGRTVGFRMDAMTKSMMAREDRPPYGWEVL